MRVFKAVLILTITSTIFSTAVFAKDCPEAISLDFGKLQERDIDETYLHTDYQNHKADAKFLSEKDVTANYTHRSQKTCFYSFSEYKVSLKRTNKYLYFDLTKAYSTLSSDSDTQIYANDFNINLRMEVKDVSNGVYRFGRIEPISHYSYYYSCGFLDCTDEDDVKVKIGTYTKLNLSWDEDAVVDKCEEKALSVAKAQIEYTNLGNSSFAVPSLLEAKYSLSTYVVNGTSKDGKKNFTYHVVFTSKGKNKCVFKVCRTCSRRLAT